jgi:hypothetical protein
VLYDALL